MKVHSKSLQWIKFTHTIQEKIFQMPFTVQIFELCASYLVFCKTKTLFIR